MLAHGQKMLPIHHPKNLNEAVCMYMSVSINLINNLTLKDIRDTNQHSIRLGFTAWNWICLVYVFGGLRIVG